MNGADLLCDVLLANDVDVCFANPGTSEMHFVAALDRKPEMRCILGLFEGVVTAAADGYARMADKPAATLLHLGPGLANGLANLHNARRARTPIVNVVGDHATSHLALDAPLTSDIESLARPMSHWVGRVRDADEVETKTRAAITEAVTKPGISTLILPADAAWGEVSSGSGGRIELPARPQVPSEKMRQAAMALRGGGRTALILGGMAMRTNALELAGKIAAKTGAALFTERAARSQRGAGRVAVRPVPYNVDQAAAAFREFETVICIGGRAPVAFFAYPDKPGRLLPEGCLFVDLAAPEHDLHGVLEALCADVGAKDATARIEAYTAKYLPAPTSRLDPNAISVALARALPEGTIICEEFDHLVGKPRLARRDDGAARSPAPDGGLDWDRHSPVDRSCSGRPRTQGGDTPGGRQRHVHHTGALDPGEGEPRRPDYHFLEPWLFDPQG